MENRKRLKLRLPSINIGNALHGGTYFDIPVRVHWTFGLLILFALWSAFRNGYGIGQTMGFLFYIVTLFFCVVLHEYGHALAARKFGIRTRDIILSPIGGIARLEKLPQKPIQEFFIAIAGPMVNAVLGVILAIIVYIFFGKISPEPDIIQFDKPVEFLRYFVWINFGLFLFNLIPAFPMDGGRILRSLLAVKFGKIQATRIASFLGGAIAVIFIITGVLDQQLILSLIGIFIFMMAGSEFQQIRMDNLLSNATAGEIKFTNFSKINTENTINDILARITKNEQNFLVFDNQNKLAGCIPYIILNEARKSGNVSDTVSEKMITKVTTVGESIILEDLIQLMKREGFIIVGVEDSDGNITGTIDRDRIEKFFQFKGA